MVDKDSPRTQTHVKARGLLYFFIHLYPFFVYKQDKDKPFKFEKEGELKTNTQTFCVGFYFLLYCFYSRVSFGNEYYRY